MDLMCPLCSKTLAVGAELYGQVVPCPHCRQEIQIPAAPPPEPVLEPIIEAGLEPVIEPEPAPVIEPTKSCPYCRETILKIARRCKFCKTEIPEGFDEESAGVRLRAKEEMIAQQAAERRRVPYAVRRWFQRSTVVVVALTLLAIAAIIVGFTSDQRSAWFSLGPLGILFGIIPALFALVFVPRDLFRVKYFGRLTPVKGARAFLSGLCTKRYRFAYYCVLDADKDDLRRLRPAVPMLGLDAESYCFRRFEGFRDYWKSLLENRQTPASVLKLRLVQIEGDLAEVSAEIVLTEHATGVLSLGSLAKVLGNCETLNVKKLFRRVDGQWYAVNGELDSGEDRFGFAILTGRETGQAVEVL